MQDVGADLRAEVDVLGLAALARDLLPALALLELEQLGAQHGHRLGLVRGLRALVLALDDDPRRLVGDAHGRVGLVHVLAAGAAGPVGVDLQVVVVDLDLADVLDHRRDLHTGEARLAAVGGVERGQANQAVNALLGAEQPVRVFSLDQERGGLDAGFLARRRLEQLDVEPAPLGPSHLHAQQHLRPVLGVGAAGPGVDRDQRVARVVGTGEQALLLELLEALLHAADLLLELARHLGVLLGELGQRLEVLGVALELAVGRQAPTRARVLGADLSRPLLVLPEPGSTHLLLQSADALAQLSWVKGSPRAA